jgi:outer membrane protein OmpA-like peptidoglycan-associated protein
MKFNKTVLGLAVALVITPSWGHGEHGSNTVWKTTDGHQVLSSNGECIRAFDFASLGRDSCHAPEVMGVIAVPVVTMEAIEAPVVTMEVMEAPVSTMVKNVEPAAAVTVFSVAKYEASIYFDTDSSVLNMTAEVALDKLIKASQGAEQLLAVQVVGHADTRGDKAYNLNLSQQRVDSIAEHLAASGVKISSSFAQGEARPVMENGVESLSASRRADVLIKAQVKTMN